MSRSIVDWSLATRVAETIAGQGPSADWVARSAAQATQDAAGAVLDYTGLVSDLVLPEGEAVTRTEWAMANIATLKGIMPVLEERMDEEPDIPGRVRGLAKATAGSVMGAEVGAVLGYASRRVLGQYDIALVGPLREPRLLFVEPNIGSVGAALEHRPEFLDWIAIHEVTHAAQFEAAPWLRAHLGGLLEQLMEGIDLRRAATRIMDAARSALSTDPRRVLRELQETSPVRVVLGPEQADALARLQAAMSAIEGYAEHVMDEAGARAGLRVSELRGAMDERRRARTPLETLLGRLLGLELKLRQYRDGRRFADAVAQEGGIETLNLLWSLPGTLPQPGELSTPTAWLRRVQPT